ncbi:MAG: YfcE family phosphodiesterase [Patescibacteria group bacterium]|nr:YfcE family phosphodiesterase [Patescibacteria group bacterium]
MKIAIISDIHDNLTNLEKFLDWAKNNQIDEIFVCGDLCAPATLVKVLAPGFAGKIRIVFGNVCDRDLEKEKADELKNIVHYGDLAEFNIGDIKVAMIHFPAKAKELAESGKYDMVFYGHTHRPWIEQVEKTVLANPGTLAGMFYEATFAAWDTNNNKLELKRLY